MQENLLGYLLGALDGEERDDIQKRLDYDPQLREQLAELETQLIPLERERWQHEPPAGLAAATCKFVADAKVTCESSDSAHTAVRQTKKSKGLRQLSEWNPRKHGWDLVDAAVAAGIFAAAAMLFFPAIANSRHQARMAACQDNLRLANVGLSVFGERNNGVLPYIPPSGNTGVAGFYAPQLVEGGFLDDDARFICPSSDLACERGSFEIPTAAEIREASGSQLEEMQKKMGGSYMYTMGHFNRGRHYSTVNRGRNFFPVMADAKMNADGKQMSPHGDHGVNVAFEGGNVRYIVGLTAHHPFFVSDRGVIEAGSHVQDAVLGHSWSRPQPLAFDGNSMDTGAARAGLLESTKCEMPTPWPITIHFSVKSHSRSNDE